MLYKQYSVFMVCRKIYCLYFYVMKLIHWKKSVNRAGENDYLFYIFPSKTFLEKYNIWYMYMGTNILDNLVTTKWLVSGIGLFKKKIMNGWHRFNDGGFTLYNVLKNSYFSQNAKHLRGLQTEASGAVWLIKEN